MNDTKLTPLSNRHSRRARSIAVMVTLVLAALGLWALNWGCADPRKEPLAPAEPGYTETIDLWNMTPVGPNGVASASFTVAQDLAAANTPGFSPARLRVAAYIAPDCQINRRQQILLDSIPYYRDSLVVPILVQLTLRKNAVVDSAHRSLVDSLERLLKRTVDSLTVLVDSSQTQSSFTWRGQTLTCDTPLVAVRPNPASVHPDTTGLDSTLYSIDSTLASLELRFFQGLMDTTRMGFELAYLNTALDARYVLSVALDSTSAFFIPNAVYADSAGHLRGQQIFSAAQDSATGLIGRGFLLDLDRLQAADISHIGRTFEVNWAVCFPGSSSPCLSPGTHTFYVRVPGSQSRVTGAVVLVYAQRV